MLLDLGSNAKLQRGGEKWVLLDCWKWRADQHLERFMGAKTSEYNAYDEYKSSSRYY